MELIRSVFGDEIFSQLQSLDEGSLKFEAHRYSDQGLDLVFHNFEISKRDGFYFINIEEVESLVNNPDDLSKLLSLGDKCKVSVQKYNVKILKDVTMPRSIKHEKLNEPSSAQIQSFPSGHSYPPEEEWSFVFGCPIYKAFPSIKGLPVILSKAEVKVIHPDAKRPISLFAVLVPLYLVFYESESSEKYHDHIFLNNAKIEVESNCSFSIIKSNIKTTITFPKVVMMQEWSQRILYMINSSTAALENWRNQVQ